MKYQLYRHVSVGTPVYGDEGQFIVGYDGIRVSHVIVEGEREDMAFDQHVDPETTRSMDHLEEFDFEQLESLHKMLGDIIAEHEHKQATARDSEF